MGTPVRGAHLVSKAALAFSSLHVAESGGKADLVVFVEQPVSI
jgi:hypothetical protein